MTKPAYKIWVPADGQTEETATVHLEHSVDSAIDDWGQEQWAATAGEMGDDTVIAIRFPDGTLQYRRVAPVFSVEFYSVVLEQNSGTVPGK